MYTRPALLLAILLATSAPLASDIYKWVDSDGQVHYTQMPPTNRPTDDSPSITTKKTPVSRLKSWTS